MLNLLTSRQLSLIKIKSFKKDDVLYRENDNCKEIGIVIDGEIIIKSYMNNGKEIIYNTINNGNLFGSNLIFSDDKRYKGDVVATKNSKIAIIKKGVLIELLQNNKEFLSAFMLKQANSAKYLNTKVKLLSLDSPLDRLMFYLDDCGGEISLSSVSDLAKELGVQRETLSRLINRLNKNKVIVYKDKKIKRL